MTAVIDSTLENVQYKFATIIGELCGKPSVLSQFAIWLDLRLAEYKLKGSISLDCSGEKPDPLWLQGHRDLTISKQSEARNVLLSSRASIAARQHTTPLRARTNVTTNKYTTSPNYTSPVANDRLSPDIVIVKEEPLDNSDVFPVSLHLHDNQSPTRTSSSAGESRKRFSTGGSDIPFHSFSLPKSRRMSPSASGTSSPLITHDSSSSDQTVITTTGCDSHNPSETTAATMLSFSDTVESGLEQIIRDSDGSYNPGDNSADFQPGSSSFDGSDSFRSLSQSHLSGQPGTSTDTVNDSMMQGSGTTCSSPVSLIANYYNNEENLLSPLRDHVETYRTWQETPHRRQLRLSAKEFAKTQGWAKKTVTNITYAFGIFSRWLQESHEDDSRDVHEIPPSELDNYLTEFFCVVKKPNGTDYSHTCLRSLRTHLARYLKDKGYPCCIATDYQFTQSQQMLRQKLEALKIAANISKTMDI